MLRGSLISAFSPRAFYSLFLLPHIQTVSILTLTFSLDTQRFGFYSHFLLSIASTLWEKINVPADSDELWADYCTSNGLDPETARPLDE